MAVVDASIVYALIRDPRGQPAAAAVAAGDLAAPALLDLEVTQKLRWDVLNGRLGSPAEGAQGVARLAALPITRHDHVGLLERIWELKANLTAYEAAYVALAEHLDTALLTVDRRLARAPGIRCRVHVPGSAVE